MLAPGTTLGPYQILGPLGAGGMGEVYRARDPRLDRTVAVKVLPPHLSASPEVRQRFEREARAVSSLNHPHICTLHDIGHQDDVDFLVMEHIEGESLAARLAKGPLPTEQVLRLGAEIADALECAHRAGIVHRDLKPGNVMLTTSGAKLVDFGLAHAIRPAEPAGGLSSVPTLGQPLTAEGTIVGTFQYMAPEQLEGKEADARTDIFALGATLYEMTTGKCAFEGKSQASLIAAILEKEPTPVSTLQPLAPPALERLIRGCLAKDPDERIQTAHDVKLQLQWIAEGGSQAGLPAPVLARRKSRERAAWILAAAGGLAAAVFATGFILRAPPPPRVLRFQIDPPAGTHGMTWPRISPDGSTLAFLATDSTGKTTIWVRPLNALEAYSLPGTEGAWRPFWSPDSKHLAFFASGKLKKVPAAGGPATLICEAANGYDGTWGLAGAILFDGQFTDTLRVVSAAGGVAEPASSLDRANQEMGHAWPQFLPDGRHFVFLAYGSSGPNRAVLKVGTLGSLESSELGRTESRAEYASPSRLVYVREGILVAQPFDPRSRKLSGEPVPLADKVAMLRGRENFSVSQTGVIAYQPISETVRRRLVWVDRKGRPVAQVGEPDAFVDMALSPDETRLALGILDRTTNREDLWIRDLRRGTVSRLTFGAGDEFTPVWSPDGSRIAYCSDEQGRLRLMQKLASGAGESDTLGKSLGGPEYPTDWSPDGRFVAYSRFVASSWDLHILPMAAGEDPFAVVATSFAEYEGQFSPDGQWIAYSSNESKRSEVYVQAFPKAAGKWQISAKGGSDPHWRGDGRELFYLSPENEIMSASIAPGAALDAGVPSPLFSLPAEPREAQVTRWLPAADGQRFLLNTRVEDRGAAPFIVVSNWQAELGKK